jgi:biotin operon repressor
MTDNYIRTAVLDYLRLFCFGRVKAVKADVLAERYQTSRREINSVIRDLRKEGHLIGSSKDKPHGYYIPANEGEVLQYMDTFKSELFDMLETFNRQKRMQRAFIENVNNHQLFPTAVNQDGQMELVLERKA